MPTPTQTWLYGSIYTAAGVRIGPVLFSPLLQVFRLAPGGMVEEVGLPAVGDQVILYRMGSNRDEGGMVTMIEASDLDGVTRFYFR
jgi:hypothetical protein